MQNAELVNCLNRLTDTKLKTPNSKPVIVHLPLSIFHYLSDIPLPLFLRYPSSIIPPLLFNHLIGNMLITLHAFSLLRRIFMAHTNN